jgi:secreted trypsin-like serine protease
LAEDDVQVGIVSWGGESNGKWCGQYKPNVFASVSHEFDWIKEKACAKSRKKAGSPLCAESTKKAKAAKLTKEGIFG